MPLETATQPALAVGVYIPAPDGTERGTTLNARSTREAMFGAVQVFMSDWWRGPRPRVGMVFRISLVYGGREFRSRVTAEMLEAAKSKRAEERTATRRDAEMTMQRISEQDANGFYADLP